VGPLPEASGLVELQQGSTAGSVWGDLNARERQALMLVMHQDPQINLFAREAGRRVPVSGSWCIKRSSASGSPSFESGGTQDG
jgi:hypothetical protein